MQLHYEKSGSGAPLIMLHGIFGSLANLGAISRILEQRFTVIRADLRNHGQSPHSDSMTYADMANDVAALLDLLQLDNAHLFGHSMGGKVVMELALSQPQRVRKLIVGDIAPVAYPPHHDALLAGLCAIELEQLQSRTDADRQLSHYVSELPVRQYLLKNLVRDNNGKFRWRLNLSAIVKNYDAAREEVGVGKVFNGDVLFIRGENSNYISERTHAAIRQKFPRSHIETIADTSHWVHAENPQRFAQLMIDFLNR